MNNKMTRFVLCPPRFFLSAYSYIFPSRSLYNWHSVYSLLTKLFCSTLSHRVVASWPVLLWLDQFSAENPTNLLTDRFFCFIHMYPGFEYRFRSSHCLFGCNPTPGIIAPGTLREPDCVPYIGLASWATLCLVCALPSRTCMQSIC
jgi:hypothetical protein